jgi:allantoate deiminase
MFKPADVNLQRIQQQIAQLGGYGKQTSGGVTRPTFSEAHQQAFGAVAGWMTEARLQVFFDRWGNLFGRSPGNEDQPLVLTGSHVDSVPNGGDYDGPLGVLSSLEAVRMILESGVTLQRPLQVVSFIEEEGSRFQGLMGSRLATGNLPDDEVASITDMEQNRFLDMLAGVDFPAPVDQTYDLRQGVASYVELHIEQARRLETADLPVGVVTSIAGPNFMRVQFTGRADHAGATEYADRHDTLLAAAEVILAVREMALSTYVDRGHLTVGRLNVQPNATNVIAGETNFDIDFRAADAEAAQAMRAEIDTLLEQVCQKHRISFTIQSVESVPPVPTPLVIREAVQKGAQAADVPQKELVSWAAHDAMVLANVCDSGMIFVRCRDGRSHCPEEYTNPEDIVAGVAVMANTLLELAR